VAESLVRFCSGVELLNEIHVSCRFAGKSIPIDFTIAATGRPVGTEDQRRSIALYDGRLSTPSAFFSGGIGTALIPTTGFNPAEPVVVMAGPALTPMRLKSPSRDEIILARFALKMLSLSQLADLSAKAAAVGAPYWDEESAALTKLLYLVPRLASPESVGKLLQYGYFTMKRDAFLSIREELMIAACELAQKVTPGVNATRTPGDLLHELATFKGELWPLIAGSPIRPYQDMVCIDVVGATDGLHRRLELRTPGGGQLGEERGGHFERATQELINSTPWAPTHSMLVLRGRSIALDGQSISNIDAIACRKEDLLLVECLSLVYTREYDVGDHKTVKDAADKIVDKVRKKGAQLATLKANLTSVSPDLSRFRRIAWVVCTPLPFWVPLGPATKVIASGLRAYSPLAELLEWLRGHFDLEE
jgi:hypothetical protein